MHANESTWCKYILSISNVLRYCQGKSDHVCFACRFATLRCGWAAICRQGQQITTSWLWPTCDFNGREIQSVAKSWRTCCAAYVDQIWLMQCTIIYIVVERHTLDIVFQRCNSLKSLMELRSLVIYEPIRGFYGQLLQGDKDKSAIPRLLFIAVLWDFSFHCSGCSQSSK